MRPESNSGASSDRAAHVPSLSYLSDSDKEEWHRVLAAGVEAQRLVPGAIAVGGTAAVLYAGHRLSQDTDHLVVGLKEHFDEILAQLEAATGWTTARTSRPVLILGSLDGVEVGYREPRRRTPIQTTAVQTPFGALIIPTLEEMIGIKAFLAYMRNALRDYLDFAALTTCTTEDTVLGALLALDDLYRGLQSSSVCLEVAKSLAAARPYDLEETDLSRYKGLDPAWHDWSRTENLCRRFGVLLGERLTDGGGA